MKTLLFSVGACLLLAASCNKSDNQPTECAQVQRAPATFLAYWYFPKGSYWVYRKRGSNPVEVDTVTVERAETQVFQPGDPVQLLPACTELPVLTAEHSNRRYFRGISSNNGFHGTEILNGTEEIGEWFVRQNSVAGNLIPLGFLWSHPQRPIGQPIANTGPTLLDTIAVTVPAGRFPRSVHLRIPFLFDSTRYDYLYDYHLTRGIGYTRKVYANLGTWELVAYRLAR